ncbi:GDSL-type esterase/lipase family protein [Pedobacter psychrodurus]|uniref:GDSL-type esterase/lipase family protein n=1 Tax=Pedobacter psychrodurus TaxID=2530456 RepID=UPI00292F1B5C|nr:GDSL-type esterase/lipase family protein [Pedobacter psychrodurus]
MRKKYFFFTVILLTTCLSAFAQEKIRIACVGNSITYGMDIANREKNSYPAQLQNMLGNTYEVMNFGHSGATLLKNTTNPYWKTKAYADALASKPNVVFIKLGSNDSKIANRGRYNEFESTYKELISSFSQLPTNPRIILLLPLPSFSTDTTYIYEPVLKNKIIPMIQKVAYESHLEVVNLHSLFLDKAGLFPDKIHPSSLGATIMATKLYETIKLGADQKFDIFPKIKEAITISNFYGYECADFTLNGRNCKVVKPKVVAKDHPWVWRARFWGHEPQTDISLLERGFYVVYCDVAELFGNAEAISLWNKFYALMKKNGLNKKVALEGMSRGGVYVYNWALANPEKVACIYADAPVLDLKSWPGGKGKGPGSKSDWEIVKKDYQLTDDQANAFDKNPLDNASKIAKLGFPMLHVVGDVDDVIPIAENTTPFEKIVRENGGDITVIHKPDVNHHPHSLPNPTPITDFILKATGQKVNFAAIAAPGAEYRSGAGWIQGKDWWSQHEDIDSLLLAEKDLDILFLGNSITQGTGGHRTSVNYKPGFKAFDSVFVNLKWESAGISGDRSQNILWRLQNGNYAKAKPKVMVVMIGVNNISAGDSPSEIVEGIKKVTDWTTKNMPSTKVLLLGPLPTGLKKDEERRKKYEEVHRLLAKQPHNKFKYQSIATPFMLPNGDLDPLKYSSDGIHLLPEGYKAWATALKPIVTEMLKHK